MNRAFWPISTLAISAGFGFVVGSSLILMFLKRHSEPSDSRARYPFACALAHARKMPTTESLMTPSLASTRSDSTRSPLHDLRRQITCPAFRVRPFRTQVAPRAEQVALVGGNLALLVLVVRFSTPATQCRVCSRCRRRIGSAQTKKSLPTRLAYGMCIQPPAKFSIACSAYSPSASRCNDHVALMKNASRRVDELPAGGIPAVEHRHESVLVRSRRRRERRQHEQTGDGAW